MRTRMGETMVSIRQMSMEMLLGQNRARDLPHAVMTPANNPHPVSVIAINAVLENSHVVTKPDGQVIS